MRHRSIGRYSDNPTGVLVPKMLLLSMAFFASIGAVSCRESESDVPYVPSPPDVATEMLKLAQVTSNDKVYDLGCGDGRIVIAAAKSYGARGVGIDINPARVRDATDNARAANVLDLVRFETKDLFQYDFSDATVVMLYLSPTANLRLRPQLQAELKPGTRIVSHRFDMGDWKPDKTVFVLGRPLYLWIISQRSDLPRIPSKLFVDLALGFHYQRCMVPGLIEGFSPGDGVAILIDS
jgi:SAM-dependent methyltransferase